MEFDSYIDFYNHLKTFDFNDIILGVKDEIVPNTLYISLGSSKTVKIDNTSFAIGYTYNLVLSVPDVDSHLVKVISDLSQDGMALVDWSESTHLYNYQTAVYLPVGSSGEPWS